MVLAPLVTTFNPGNPPFYKWIQDNMSILHQEPKVKKAILKIDCVTRQAKNIEQDVIKSRHCVVAKNRQTNQPHLPPPGNYKLHSKNCVTCSRMEDGKTCFKSSRTGREYRIFFHYTCGSTHLVILVKWDLCDMDYVGQTTKPMRR